MSRALITESHLTDIAAAIRAKNGSAANYRPGDMAAAIREIGTSGITPAGTVNITENGTVDVTQYASASVNVPTPTPNLQSKTVTANGTVTADAGYDGLSSVVVNVEGGSGGEYSESIIKYIFDYKTGKYAEGYEYAGNVYGNTAMIDDLGLVLLGDFSQDGEATGNTLSDSLSNYSAVILNGVYQKNRTSGYNTSMMHISPELNKAYWAGMKDRNNNYTCTVTFTDSATVSLTGNRQVIIYGVP